jgi:hypothetical protein
MNLMNYYIASLKNTRRDHEHIQFRGPEYRGYTPVVGQYAGQYGEQEALKLNDGEDCIAVPVEEVKALLSPEPYSKPGMRFYDQRGPVVVNSRENWTALLLASLKIGRQPGCKPKPEIFRGKRRAFSEVELSMQLRPGVEA